MKKIIDFFDKTPVTKILSSLLIMAMAVIMTMNVILRYCFHFSFNWGDEILRYMCVYMAFLGTAAAFHTPGVHVAVTLFVEKLLPEKFRKYARLLSDILTIAFLIVLTYFGFVLCGRIMGSGQKSAALRVPMWLIYGIVPVSAILSIVQMLLQIFKQKTYTKERD